MKGLDQNSPRNRFSPFYSGGSLAPGRVSPGSGSMIGRNDITIENEAFSRKVTDGDSISGKFFGRSTGRPPAC